MTVDMSVDHALPHLSTVIPAEIAEVVEKLNRGELSYISDSGPVYRGPTLLMSEAASLIERLAASQAETRRLALEEAAKVADQIASEQYSKVTRQEDRHTYSMIAQGARETSKGIRALIDQQ